MPGPWGVAIARLRAAVPGLTRKAVAKRAKMTPTTYGRIEKGQHTQTRKLQRIADVFAVPIETVLLPHVPEPRPLTMDDLARLLQGIPVQSQSGITQTLKTLDQQVRSAEQVQKEEPEQTVEAETPKKSRRIGGRKK